MALTPPGLQFYTFSTEPAFEDFTSERPLFCSADSQGHNLSEASQL